MGNGSKLPPDVVAVLMREGAFRGLKMLLERQKISEAEGNAVLARTYKAIHEQLDEAKTELQRIQAALSRMESVCRAAKSTKRLAVDDSSRTQMGNALVDFDNWVVSLMETNMTITGLLNPSLTRRKITEFGTAMNALMDKRAAESHPVLDDPSLFSGYVNW